jgi:hypothetical protein
MMRWMGRQQQKWLIVCVGILLLSACNLNTRPTQPTLPSITIESSPLPEPTLTPSQSLGNGLTDESFVMSGICFEAAYDSRERVFVLKNAVDHINFYDLADNSRLCRQPVIRHPYDFRENHALVGTWSYGAGCKASHTLESVTRDAATQTVTITARFATEGECNYELIRPLWLGLTLEPFWKVELVVEK